MADDNQGVKMEHIHKLDQRMTETQSNMDCLMRQSEKNDEQYKNLMSSMAELISDLKIFSISVQSVQKQQEKTEVSIAKLDDRMDEMDKRVSVLQETIRWMSSKPVIAGVFVLVLIAASPFIKSLLT